MNSLLKPIYDPKDKITFQLKMVVFIVKNMLRVVG
jgi:hypothetical protein